MLGRCFWLKSRPGVRLVPIRSEAGIDPRPPDALFGLLAVLLEPALHQGDVERHAERLPEGIQAIDLDRRGRVDRLLQRGIDGPHGLVGLASPVAAVARIHVTAVPLEKRWLQLLVVPYPFCDHARPIGPGCLVSEADRVGREMVPQERPFAGTMEQQGVEHRVEPAFIVGGMGGELIVGPGGLHDSVVVPAGHAAFAQGKSRQVPDRPWPCRPPRPPASRPGP